MVDPITRSAPASEDHLLSAYNYELPNALIAQDPVSPRDSARLLVVHPTHHTHQIFRDLPTLLQPGDLLVLNNTRVIPARLYGRKPSGAKVTALLLKEQDLNCWLALVKPGQRLQTGATILFSNEQEGGEGVTLTATVVAIDIPTGGRVLQFDVPEGTSLAKLLSQVGQVPLPPYITQSQADPEEYQTVYAEHLGAVAAPTAGLHFTPELLTQLTAHNIPQAYVTLHVGVGTFRSVEVEDITTHDMHGEWIDVPPETVAAIQQTRSQGGRIIAVGTTVVRALEGAAQSGTLQPFQGEVNLYIYPGYEWRIVQGLITNFHLPRSSLLMLVSALIGRDRLMALYQEAIDRQYRFFSFGDAMLILPKEP